MYTIFFSVKLLNLFILISPVSCMNLLPPSAITLPWRQDAAEFWFTRINDKPWSILLHSGYANHPHSRFDIIVADPMSWIETHGIMTKISEKGKITYSKKDPLVLLENMLHNSKFYAYHNPDLPFQGGALGLFGYDLSRRFEHLPKQAHCDITLPDMALGFYDWALIVDHHKKNVTLLSHTDPYARLAWLNTQHSIKKPRLQLISNWRSNMTLQQYNEKFNRIKTYLKNGDCYQVNLAQRFQADYIGDEWKEFCRLNMDNRAPFSAFLRLTQGTILSLSPERFIQLANRNIQTRPIKGTLPRLKDPKEDHQQSLNLSLSQKDRAENVMIVDLMRNDIGRVAEPGSVHVPELFIVETFSTVHHLVSTITAKLAKPHNACSLLRAAFPAGSITGAPKVRAMEIIDELEPHRRNAWCGSIGYLSLCGNMDTNITIRTLIGLNGKLYCSAGGAIVFDSQVQEEYQETLDKIYRLLQLISTT